MAQSEHLRDVYDGASATIRMMRAMGWGPQLLNLGYYTVRGPLNALNLIPSRFRLAKAQERMVRKAAELLAPAPGDRMLDIACGRGLSSYYLATTNPGSEVAGVDLLPANVQIASTLYAHTRGLSYGIGDAQALSFTDQSFDRALCLEVAFHFPDRRRFLAEAARVLKPGGRLVVIDFVWQRRDPRVLADERTRFVQRTWGWEDFSSLDEYRNAAEAAGFTVEAVHDWTARVTEPLQGQFDALARLAVTRWGRFLLLRTNAMVRGLSRADWQEVARSADAHRFVRKHSRYVALVLRQAGRGAGARRAEVGAA